MTTAINHLVAALAAADAAAEAAVSAVPTRPRERKNILGTTVLEPLPEHAADYALLYETLMEIRGLHVRVQALVPGAASTAAPDHFGTGF